MQKLIRGFTLAEGATHVARFDNKRKVAFTLAEVLITLGIIGVVAAMTLPALLTNMRNRELHSALNKAYSSIQTAVQNVNVEEGVILVNISGDFTTGVYKNKLLKHFNVINNCTNNSNGHLYNCLNGEQLLRTYKTYSNDVINRSLFDDGQFITQDGMFFMLENPTGGSHILVSVDLNGQNKNPNRWGYDVFTFEIMSDGKLMPEGVKGSRYSDQNEYCSKTSNNNYNGIGCTYRALYDKDYWKNLP